MTSLRSKEQGRGLLVLLTSLKQSKQGKYQGPVCVVCFNSGMNHWKQLLWYHDVCVSVSEVWFVLNFDPHPQYVGVREGTVTCWIGILWRNNMSFWFSLWINPRSEVRSMMPCPGVHLLNRLVVLLPNTWLHLATCHQLRIPEHGSTRNLSTGPHNTARSPIIVFNWCTPTRLPLKQIHPSPYVASKPHKQRVITHDAEQMGSSTALLLPTLPPSEIANTSPHISHEVPQLDVSRHIWTIK